MAVLVQGWVQAYLEATRFLLDLLKGNRVAGLSFMTASELSGNDVVGGSAVSIWS